jgi:hypothetical protein
MHRSPVADLKKRFAASYAWRERHWAELRVVGYLLAFAILFGGVALAAYNSGFASGFGTAALCGAAAIYFIRIFVRSILAVQRLIGTLHPESEELANPDEIPGWAKAVYALIGIALVLAIMALEQTYTHAAMELFVGWGIGLNLLSGFWPKRDRTTLFGTAFDVFDRWLDDKAARHRVVLGILGTTLGFAALFGGVALYAWQSGVTRIAAAVCSPACLATPGFQTMVAAGCGAAAILFVTLYTRLALAAQRVFIDPFKFVRPEPKPQAAAKWVTVIHVILGFILLFVMTGVGQMQIPHLKISSEQPEAIGLILGWWLGGRTVLRFFWAKWRRGETAPRFRRGGAGA